ncbi:serine/threonine-protein kinase [Streptomyces sp. NPDC048290]|uniref:serine/threonine-protein kinase n=1 Tax=Streptomyces sp. NPDC048290 TaxID=3155811 RepID=UPI003445225A
MSDGGAHRSSEAEGPVGGGQLIGGRYRLAERIGSGGMGAVWRAHDDLVDREVAVKQPHLPGSPDDPAHQRAAHRLHREARAAARVDHPCAVTIHDVVVEDGLPWIVMELIRGESLYERLLRGTLSPVETARIGLAVLGALRAAHAVGIVHRDVKPANVLLGPHGRVVLTDFGIAHVQGEESLTVSGEFVGSLEFIAPERMSGRGAGPASDLWSLGVLLYAAVEGGSPFRRTSLESTLAAILAADPPEPERAGPLGPLILHLLRREPEARPDAVAVGEALEGVVGSATGGWAGGVTGSSAGSSAGFSVGSSVGVGPGELPPGTDVTAGDEAGEEAPEGTGQETGAAQEPEGLREFGEDQGTVLLGQRAGERAEAAKETEGKEAAPGAGSAAGSATGEESAKAAGSAAGSATGEESAKAAGSAAGSATEEESAKASAKASASAAGEEERARSETGAGQISQAPRKPPHRRPLAVGLAVGLVGALLAGGVWAGIAAVGEEGGGADGAAGVGAPPAETDAEDPEDEPDPDDGDDGTEPAGTSGSPSGSADAWVSHTETEMAAVLALPEEYQEIARQGGPDYQPRLVVYSAGDVDVRLTQWDRAPKDARGQAEAAHDTWAEYDPEARTQYTETGFEDGDAVIADTTYTVEGTSRLRVMELMILTDDGRMYELRVDMPKGTPQERSGTSVFKGARDRLLLTPVN